MAGPKTSAEKAREDEKNAVADDMFGGAFGGLEGMETPEIAPAEDPVVEDEQKESEQETQPDEIPVEETPADEEQVVEETPTEEIEQKNLF